MTPAQAKTLLDSGVLQAYAEEKPIQFLHPEEQKINKPWRDFQYGINMDPPGYLEIMNWRVKPEKKTGWIALYKNGHEQITSVFFSYKPNVPDAIACIQITYEEGEGL